MAIKNNCNRLDRPVTFGWNLIFGIVAIIATLGVSISIAEAFTNGSTGVDGPLDFTGFESGTIIDFDPKTFTPPFDTDGDSVYHFTTINIPEGVTVKLRANKAGFAPIRWLATGAVIINGMVDLNGTNGHAANRSLRGLSLPGPGGFHGGMGADAIMGVPATQGFGPGGGCVTDNGKGWPAGHTTIHGGTDTNCPNLTKIYGTRFLLPLVGGSGGAGSRTTHGYSAAGGGAGGGAILIASPVSITVNGKISANGGSAVDGSGASGGSGGAIRLVSKIVTGNGRLTTDGGSTWWWDSSPSSSGRTRIETLGSTFTGLISGEITSVTMMPEPILLPSSGSPVIRIASVDNLPVPSTPRGIFTPADITINKPLPVAIAIEGKNIPIDTKVTITVLNETEGPIVIESSPLAGTMDSSTATVDLKFPTGFSQIFTYAKW
jgi:hypothetical protein